MIYQWSMIESSPSKVIHRKSQTSRHLPSLSMRAPSTGPRRHAQRLSAATSQHHKTSPTITFRREHAETASLNPLLDPQLPRPLSHHEPQRRELDALVQHRRRRPGLLVPGPRSPTPCVVARVPQACEFRQPERSPPEPRAGKTCLTGTVERGRRFRGEPATYRSRDSAPPRPRPRTSTSAGPRSPSPRGGSPGPGRTGAPCPRRP